MNAVAALPGWAAQLTANPRNREILLAQDPEEIHIQDATMGCRLCLFGHLPGARHEA
jgi:hypothetical protein